MNSGIIELPKILDTRGNLSFIESLRHVPFEIKRVYWIYDVPGDTTRGGHAFRCQEEFIVALSGSFDVVIDNGKEKITYHLNRSYKGLYVPKGMWRRMENFSTNSLALVLASTNFNENDYIRDYSEFRSGKFGGEDNTLGNDYSKFSSLTENATSICDTRYTSTVYDCEVVELDKNHRDMGNITVFENGITLPFEVKRIYYLYDVPGGEERGGHGHKALQQLIIAAGGSFDVELFDGINKRTVTLNRPYQGLRIVPGIWRELKNYSSGATTLVLASELYDETDYIRDYGDFLKYKIL